MSEPETAGNAELQFDRVVSQPGAGAPNAVSVTCAACQSPIETEYFDLNGHSVCAQCRTSIEAHAEPPRGVGPLLTAGVFGLGAVVAGAAIYYAVMAIAHLEIGIVAILIGYMVGFSVRKGAKGRGGLRFQVLAVTLTYFAVAFAYTPLAIQGAIDARRQQELSTPAAAVVASTQAPRPTQAPPSAGRLLLFLLTLIGLIAALPVMLVFGSLPFGLISGFIIFIGMRQAWRMTGAPWVQVLGPYRVGVTATSPAP
jgi:hypothetical protein